MNTATRDMFVEWDWTTRSAMSGHYATRLGWRVLDISRNVLRGLALGTLLSMQQVTIPSALFAVPSSHPRSPVYAEHGIVCAAQPLAVQAGIDILKQGGSAVDAAIAVNACLGLMEPTANGLGGDMFAIVWDPRSKKLYGLNASGRAPLGLSSDMVPPAADGTVPLYSPYAWTVPGTCDGWFELHKKFGKLSMKRVLGPAIGYAENGFPVSPVIADAWERSVARFGDKPGFAEVFMPGGRTPLAGEVFRNPALAHTLGIVGA